MRVLKKIVPQNEGKKMYLRVLRPFSTILLLINMSHIIHSLLPSFLACFLLLLPLPTTNYQCAIFGYLGYPFFFPSSTRAWNALRVFDGHDCCRKLMNHAGIEPFGSTKHSISMAVLGLGPCISLSPPSPSPSPAEAGSIAVNFHSIWGLSERITPYVCTYVSKYVCT